MADLVGIKFQAGLHTEDNKAKGWSVGHAKYPDFNQVDPTLRNNMDWCVFIGVSGVSMLYDTEYGHKEHHVDSPVGEQTCVIAVPEDFANAAVTLFPELIKITPAEFEDFYNNKATVSQLAEILDSDVVNMIKAKEDAGIPVPEKANAYDPNHSDRGIRKNLSKKWSDFKGVVGINIVEHK
jgi:hypothetical protein